MIHKTFTVILTVVVLCSLIAPAALGGGPDLRPYYTSTMDELGVTYDVWDVATQGNPSANDLMGYKMVIWFTGYTRSDTFTSANEAAVATYLDAGGRFCLVSEDYLYDRGLTSFGQSRLRIGSYTSDVNRTDPVGNAGHSIGNGLGPYNLTAPAGWPGDLYTDNVNHSGGWGVSSPFRWSGTGQNNSTSYSCAAYKTVFLGWPLEGLANLADRAEVMGAIIAWFGGCSGLGANPACVLLVDDDQAPTYYIYLPLVLKQERG